MLGKSCQCLVAGCSGRRVLEQFPDGDGRVLEILSRGLARCQKDNVVLTTAFPSFAQAVSPTARYFVHSGLESRRPNKSLGWSAKGFCSLRAGRSFFVRSQDHVLVKPPSSISLRQNPIGLLVISFPSTSTVPWTCLANVVRLINAPALWSVDPPIREKRLVLLTGSIKAQGLRSKASSPEHEELIIACPFLLPKS